MLTKLADGRTDLVFDYVAAGNPATAIINGMPLIRQCAYYGDVSAIRFLLAKGESLRSLGQNFDPNGACFHGHWRLCQSLSGTALMSVMRFPIRVKHRCTPSCARRTA